MSYQRFAGVDPVQESLTFDNRCAYEDAADEYADFALAMEEEEPLFPQPEPVEDPSRYATEAEYYDLGGLLNESCGPLLDDDLPGVLDPAVAADARARIRRRAAA